VTQLSIRRVHVFPDVIEEMVSVSETEVALGTADELSVYRQTARSGGWERSDHRQTARSGGWERSDHRQTARSGGWERLHLVEGGAIKGTERPVQSKDTTLESNVFIGDSSLTAKWTPPGFIGEFPVVTAATLAAHLSATVEAVGADPLLSLLLAAYQELDWEATRTSVIIEALDRSHSGVDMGFHREMAKAAGAAQALSRPVGLVVTDDRPLELLPTWTPLDRIPDARVRFRATWILPHGGYLLVSMPWVLAVYPSDSTANQPCSILYRLF